MDQPIEAKYDWLGKIIYKDSLRQSKTFFEKKDTATDYEKVGAQLLVMFHLLNIIDKTAHVDFKRVMACTITEFSVNSVCGDFPFDLYLEITEKFENVPLFLLNRFSIFKQDYEIALKRGTHIGHLGFYCFYINLLSNPDLKDQNTIVKIVSSDTIFRKKLNEHLATFIPIWQDKTVPVMIKSAFLK